MTAIFVVSLPALGLWIQAGPSDAGDNRDYSKLAKQGSKALSAIVRRGLTEGEVSDARQWKSFRAAKVVVGGVPRRARIAIAATLGGRVGVDALSLEFDSGRRLGTPSGFTLWMVPGPGVMCLVRMQRVATTCSTKQAAIRRGLLLQTHRMSTTAEEPPFSVIGVMPSWATQVSLRAGGVPVTIPITANAFDFAATQSIKVMRLIG